VKALALLLALAGSAAAEEEDDPKVRPAQSTARMRDGSSVSGDLVGLSREWVVIDTGSKVVTLPRANVLTLSNAPGANPQSQLMVKTEPPRDRVRNGAFFAFAITPRFLELEICGYASFNDCLESSTESGYAVSGSIEIGVALRKRYTLSILTALGGASAGGGSTLIWDQLVVGRVTIVGGWFVEAGAGLSLTSDRFGFGGRLGFGYEVVVARNFTFAPALTATGSVGPSQSGRITIDAQLGARYYF